MKNEDLLLTNLALKIAGIREIFEELRGKIINYKNKIEKLNLIFFLRYFIIKM